MSPLLMSSISILVIIASALFIKARIETQQVKLTKESLGKVEPHSKQLKLCFFSDYHHPFNQIPVERIFQWIKETKPDLVIFGGDNNSCQRCEDEAQFILGRIAAYCHDLQIPYLAVRGNHDKQTTNESAAKYETILLQNESFIVFDQQNNPWQIIGYEDLRLGQLDPAAKTKFHPKSPHVEEQIPAARTIAVTHNPDSILQLDSSQQRFNLAGHFHNGQIKLPLRLEYKILRPELLGKLGFTQGAYEINGLYQYITAGLGNVLFPLRLGARPEFSCLTIYESVEPSDSTTNDAKIKEYLESKRSK